MTVDRRRTRTIFVGGVGIGGDHPVSIQSMTNTDTCNRKATLAQISRLYRAGCEIVRVAVPDGEAAAAIGDIVKRSPIPVIADIHFDHALAIAAIRNGAACIRINPGNIKNRSKLRDILSAATEKGVPIRIGVNAGSLDHRLRTLYRSDVAGALVENALECIKFFEDSGFTAIKVALKSADVPTTVAAYRLFSARSDYPVHIGITEAGTEFSGTVRSAVGIGCLLMEGIGDTLRVSLTAPPEREIAVAREILKASGVRTTGPTLISCPTCARREIDVISIARKVETSLKNVTSPIKVAVMGCPVNGPGEAMEADIGLAGSASGGIIFKHGKVVMRIREPERIVPIFVNEIRKLDAQWRKGDRR